MTQNDSLFPISLDTLSLETLERLQKEVEEKKRALKAKSSPARKAGDLNRDRLQKLVEAHLAIEAQEAAEAGALGYMARALTLATIPHSKQESNEFHRKNGAFSMSMLAPSNVGLPYGSKPRLLIAYLTTEAVRKGERDVILGSSLSEFMKELGLQSTGGRWGSITGLKQQMTRLFSSSVHCQWENKDSTSIANMPIVSKAQLWWNPKTPEQTGLWESTVRLGEDFFNEVVANPIPIDLRAVRALKQSPMALDIYFWLTHRMSYLRRTNARDIPWEALQLQFGAGYPTTRKGVQNFRQQFVGQMRKVLAVYPQAKVEDSSTGLILKPSPSHIRRIIT
jgi:hypothetical protein